MKQIRDVKKDLIKVGVVTAVGAVTVGGVYYSGYKAADNARETAIKNSNMRQDGFIASIQEEDLNYEKIVEQIRNDVELVLLAEQGMTNIKLETFDKDWNKFITHSSTEMSVEYIIKVGLNTEDIAFVPGDKKLNVIIDRDDIYINSTEIVNKNILTNRALLGAKLSDDEKIALEKKLMEEVKTDVLENKKNIDKAIDNFEDYIKGLAKTFDTDIDIIIK